MKSLPRPQRGKAKNDTAAQIGARPRSASVGVNFLDDFSLRLTPAGPSSSWRASFIRIQPVEISFITRIPYAILSDALPHSPSHQVGGSRRLFQPRRVVRRQTASARETHDVISDAFANNARSLRFAIVIYGAIRPLSSARLGVYCICRRRCIVRRDDNAIRDADAR